MLAPLGRFIDISKRDALSGTPISMSHFAKATSYIAVELGSLSKFQPESMSQLLDTVLSQHNRTPFKLLYCHGFSGVEGLKEAYRLMESGKHIGKIVVDLSGQPGVMRMYRPRPLFDPRKSYILVGGCGGLGPRLAVSLFANGARNVILTGRRGVVDRVDRLTIESFIGDEHYRGANVRFMAADACDEHAMKKVVEAANAVGPLGGIFLMSVVLADDLFVNMTPEKFETVNKSKIGALATLENVVPIHQLDFLFLFSSTAALFFNPGQSNYNAAQSFFDRYARDYSNVISFAVPAISDIGVFAALRASKNSAALQVLDALACTSSELCQQIEEAVARTLTGRSQHVPYVIPELNWKISYGISQANQTSIAHLVTHVDDKDHDKESTTEDPVGKLITKILNVDVSTVEDTVHLSSLGLDSLSASRLSGVLESELGVHVSQLQLLGPVSVRALRDLANVAAAKKATTLNGVDSQRSDERKLALITDTTFNCISQVDALDDTSISAGDLIYKGIHTTEPTIFLTGATGFLGRSILSALFDRFPKATIACLVRASTPQQGLDRIQNACEQALVWKPEWKDRIKIILGECCRERLGMSFEDWEWAVQSVEWIVHAAGVADHLKPYASLSVNSTSTKEILCLATTYRLKAVQYISSTNLFAFSGLETISESHNIHDLDQSTFTGYAQSKWIAEVLCERARGRGVPVMVIRPATLGGSSQTGVLSLDSFVWRFVLAVCEMGMAPNVPFHFSVTPVDWCAGLIVALGACQQAWHVPVFHITNPEMFTWADLPSMIPDGVPPCKIIPLEEWQKEFERQVQNNVRNPMVPLAHYVRHVRQTRVVLPRFLGENSRRVLGEGFVECPRTAGEVGRLYGKELLKHFMASSKE
ncbi:thioester reductase domain-containing protein [Spizellomyces punctatus DAOM BR117]|uniref:Thioester reductase domain-containing protein n=1 Tax=Spizellomyces punctatus (strain DAOM BR117) TaxID=645134 RepID=A0A0L0HSI9_SPIPD|nr:thioester reductase domain-containing protein [Spizellomyces punctatus DAOM BR117]KND03834.1 thioester reductase domain-containing protein [Spizellomyces punctatus DAOM BR117]|eukprot:XP_016611873.1 thioester reductase domain-containing protein [Spizellomyces punctatus DAOM BR117]